MAPPTYPTFYNLTPAYLYNTYLSCRRRQPLCQFFGGSVRLARRKRNSSPAGIRLWFLVSAMQRQRWRWLDDGGWMKTVRAHAAARLQTALPGARSVTVLALHMLWQHTLSTKARRCAQHCWRRRARHSNHRLLATDGNACSSLARAALTRAMQARRAFLLSPYLLPGDTWQRLHGSRSKRAAAPRFARFAAYWRGAAATRSAPLVRLL